MDPFPMDRSWSADSNPSPTHTQKPSFDINKPRKHHTRSSTNQHDGARGWRKSKSNSNHHHPNNTNTATTTNSTSNRRTSQDLASFSGDSTASSSSAKVSQGRRSSAISASTSNQVRKRSSLPVPAQTWPQDDHQKKRRTTPQSQGQDLRSAADLAKHPSYGSATYAASLSSGPGQMSSSGSDIGSSTDKETFNWDVSSHQRSKRNSANCAADFDQARHHTSNSSFSNHLSVSSNKPGGGGGGRRLSNTQLSRGLSPARNPSSAATSKAEGKTLRYQQTSNGTSKNGTQEAWTVVPGMTVAHAALPQGKRSSSVVRRRLRINPTIEALLMTGAAAATCYRLSHDPNDSTRAHVIELGIVTVTSVLYFFMRSPNDKGAIWATDGRNYRESNEDGALNALLLGPLLATTVLFNALDEQQSLVNVSPGGEPLPLPRWRVEGPPRILQHTRPTRGGLSALILSRYSLVSLLNLTSTVLLCHLLATKWIKKPHEFPRSNWRRLGSFTLFALALSLLLELVRETALLLGLPLWESLARWELVTAALIFQADLYTISRLARKSFTLGELGIVAMVGVTLSMEAINLTIAKLLPVTTPFVKTFRRPTPLLIFQLALVVGTFIVGFLLSPLLYLSRNLAQKPTHRLRWPDKRNLHRRLLAGFFYLFTTLYVVGVLGMWVRWLLVRKDPWIWALQFLLQGERVWSRAALVAYWLCLVGISVSGWSAVVTNAKRFKTLSSTYSRNGSGGGIGGASSSLKINVKLTTIPNPKSPAGIEIVEGGGGGSSSSSSSTSNKKANGGNAGMTKGVGINGNSGGGGGGGTVVVKEATTLKKATHLSLNARRKFFHALAVLLFVPGIAFDPAFTHLAFSLAFSIFIFAEYVRYYALYPFGASLHVFMSEFLDQKDSGPVILSHFYLLTGCAGPLWIEGPSSILHQTGVLVLGVGDAIASIVGRRYGRLHWPSSPKTVEGSMAFLLSILLSAWSLRSLGLCHHFDMARFSILVALLGLLEGVSDQNDNLVLPIFAVIIGSLVGL